MSLTPQQIRIVMPGCPDLDGFAAAINATWDEFGITSPVERAFFLAECSYECDQGREMEEPVTNGPAYEGRMDLGNTVPGDGSAYRGRGLIQITGRYAYGQCGAELGIDLLGQPSVAAQMPIGARVAGWFWTWKPGLRAAAEACNFDMVTRLINGACTEEAPSWQSIRRRFLIHAKIAVGA